MHRILLTCICILISHLVYSQSSNIDAGCLPLTVQFDAPNANSYYWDFGDGGSSKLQKAEHIFTDAGTFMVKLYTDNSASQLVGEIEIKVYPGITVNLSSDATTGCTPSDISFTSSVNKHQDILIDSYLWTFGEGGSSNLKDPVYTYNTLGNFNVSLSVKTNFSDCHKTIIKENYILIDEHEATFTLDKTVSCTTPATFIINNTSQNIPGYTYRWSLGNGEELNQYNPGSITYTEKGKYRVTLYMTAPNGCVDTYSAWINVGEPGIDLFIDEATCIETDITLINLTNASEHRWSFGSGSTPTTSRGINPTWKYSTPGVKTVTYEAIVNGCSADTTFNIIIDPKLSDFSVAPESICSDPAILQLKAKHQNLYKYYWNGEKVSKPANIDVEYKHEKTDSFHVNRVQTITYSLKVETQSGCVDSTLYAFDAQLPEAFFIPDSVIGMAPLTITFEDHSTSTEDIVKRVWDFNDGPKTTLGANDLKIKHTFEEPGSYYVKLHITNEMGCEDESKGTWIDVLEFIDPTISGSGDAGDCDIGGGGAEDEIICTGQAFSYNIVGRSIFDYHIFTDEGRFDQCWKDRGGFYTPHFPGEFPLILDTEHKGFLLDRDTFNREIVVHGARAKIDYEKNCEDIYSVEFWNSGYNHNQVKWYHEGQIISGQDKFSYRFEEKGIHTVILEAYDREGLCTPHRDTVDIHVVKAHADFAVEDVICDNIFSKLDASTSEDVHKSCGNHYLWEFEDQRPRSVASAKTPHQFKSGRQKLKLTVTDINGCKDSFEKEISVYGTEIDFDWEDAICLPHEAFLENYTVSDTTINDWSWSIGSAEKSPVHIFTEKEWETFDTIKVKLKTVDAVGCIDSLEKEVMVYKPESSINLPKSKICEKEVLNISADDFKEGGSFLKYEWDFGPAGEGDGKSENVTFTHPGDYDIKLYFEEASSGCRDTLEENLKVLAAPEASFKTSVDNTPVICYPHTVEFTNTSVIDGSTYYEWDFGEGSTSDFTNTAISYDKGEFTIKLIAESNIGCKDTAEHIIKLVGPSADLVAPDRHVCLGDELKLELKNISDVSEMIWDMGDGTVIKNQNPIVYKYEFLPNSAVTKIDVVLKSAENGCESFQSLPIQIHDVIADFELDEKSNYCEGLAGFTNLSSGGNKYLWEFGNGETSTDFDPSFIFDTLGKQTIKLTTTHLVSDCSDSFEIDIDLEGVEQFYKFPNVFSPNGDGLNDLFRPIINVGFEDVVEIKDFQIFNRWGDRVFESKDFEGWDGTFNGSPLSPDVFGYIIEMDIKDCEVVTSKGNVTLLK